MQSSPARRSAIPRPQRQLATRAGSGDASNNSSSSAAGGSRWQQTPAVTQPQYSGKSTATRNVRGSTSDYVRHHSSSAGATTCNSAARTCYGSGAVGNCATGGATTSIRQSGDAANSYSASGAGRAAAGEGPWTGVNASGSRIHRGSSHSSMAQRRSNSSPSPSGGSRPPPPPPPPRRSSPSEATPSSSSFVGINSVTHPLVTSFNHVLRVAPPSVPPAMLRGLERRDTSVLGKVKVMLRVAPPIDQQTENNTFLHLDARQKQLTIYEPATSSLANDFMEERTIGVAAPKMFAFDAIFSPDNSQAEVCSKSLVDVLPAVVNGSDGCLLTYGYSKLGKSYTMFGDSETTQDLGVLPCAISWLFKLIGEQRQKTGARFSVRVSATEIAGKGEVLRDLLASYANGTEGCVFSPGMYLQEDPVFGQHLQNQCELRAPTAEKAAFYLDAALAASNAFSHENDGINHVIFTLHVYQYRVDKSGKGGVEGGRSRLYFVDLGGCEKQSQVYNHSRSYRLSLANLGNVILAIFNGQKHVPYKDSKLTQLLREILGNITCRAAMIAHVSALPNHYSESLGTIQLASRIHRLRHKKYKQYNGGAGEDDHFGNPRRRTDDMLRSSSSDFDCTTSSSEQSCDTVIFVGERVVRERTLHEGVEESSPALQQQQQYSRHPATSNGHNYQPAHSHAISSGTNVGVVRPSYAQIRRTTAGGAAYVTPPPADAQTTGSRGPSTFRTYSNSAGCHLPPFLPQFNNASIPEEVLENFARANFGCTSSPVSRQQQQPVQYWSTSHQESASSRQQSQQPRLFQDDPHTSSRVTQPAQHHPSHRGNHSGEEYWVDGPWPNKNRLEGGRRVVPRHRDANSAGGAVVANCAPSTAAVGNANRNQETWVDGPQATNNNVAPATVALTVADRELGRFLDEQKRSMVEQWIAATRSPEDEVVSSCGEEDGGGGEMDTMSAFAGSLGNNAGGCCLELCDEGGLPLSPRQPVAGSELEVVSTVDSFVSSETEFDRGSRMGTAAPTVDDDDHLSEVHDVPTVTDDLYRLAPALRVTAAGSRDNRVSSDDGVSFGEEEGDEEATAERSGSAEDGEGQVAMIDSWVQVSEEEILWACRSVTDFADEDDELPDYYEDDDYEAGDHPLRILSSESLAVSFTNSSRRSWDSGLNAVRRAMAAVAATAQRTSNGCSFVGGVGGSGSEKSCAKFSVGAQCDFGADYDDEDDESNYVLLDRLDLDYEVSSVRSDPGAVDDGGGVGGSKRRPPMIGGGLCERLGRRHGSRSLEDLSGSCENDLDANFDRSYRNGDHRTSWSGAEVARADQSAVADECFHGACCPYGEFCDRCSSIDVLRCPDGASDPHLDRHRRGDDSSRHLAEFSETDNTGCPSPVEARPGNCGVSVSDFRDDATPMTRCLTNSVTSRVGDFPAQSKPTVPAAVKVSNIPRLAAVVTNNNRTTVAVSKRSFDKQQLQQHRDDGLSRISKTTASICCAVSGFRSLSPADYTNCECPGNTGRTSELSRCKLSNLKNGNARWRVSPSKQDVILPKDSFYALDDEKHLEIRDPRISIKSSHCAPPVVYFNGRPKPCSPRIPEDHTNTLEDKVSYDSGTGSSGGSTNGSSKEDPKMHSSIGTSSGYESIPRSSDGTCSLSTNQDSVSLSSDETTPGVKRKSTITDCCNASITSTSHSRSIAEQTEENLSFFPLARYEQEDVERMERRRALEKDLDSRRRRIKILKLRQKQEELRKELALAKSLLMADSTKWSYDLYVEDSMDCEDPSFLEALERETQILEKRVIACKSHIVMVTSFDVTGPTPKLQELPQHYEPVESICKTDYALNF